MDNHRVILATVVVLCAGSAPAAERAPPAFPDWIRAIATAACEAGRSTSGDITAQLARTARRVTSAETLVDTDAATGIRLQLDDGGEVQVTARLPGTASQRVRVTYTPPHGRQGADLFAQVAPDCRIDLARMVERDDAARPVRLIGYEGDLQTPSSVEELNPPVPAGTDSGGVAVASLDTGVAYTLPLFRGRLARDAEGRLIGHDFTDDDDRPFDLDPSRPPVFPIRHGTATTSILLREAPGARLVPLRYAAGDPARFADAVGFIAAGPARIVSMPLGGAQLEEWEPFADAVRRHPEILFVVSAGNDGRDIDAAPVFPAAFDLDNVLVVTSTDAFGRLARESNWGARSVDIAVPGERIDVVDHRGAAGKGSGTSYAVPRVAALAARMKARHVDWDAAAIKAAIMALAVPLGDASRPIRAGWIPNPAIE